MLTRDRTVEPRRRVSGLLESEGFSRAEDEFVTFWEELLVAVMKLGDCFETLAMKSDI